MRALKRYDIQHRLENKHHLHLLEGSIHNIPERVEEYDKDMFVVFNAVRQKYEIHSLQYPGDTYQMTVPFDILDGRTIKHIWKNDITVHGRNIFRRMEAGEERHKRKKEKEYRNWIRDVAGETKSMFAKDAWQ